MVSFLKTNLHEYFYAQKSGQNDKHILHDLAMTALRYLFSVWLSFSIGIYNNMDTFYT